MCNESVTLPSSSTFKSIFFPAGEALQIQVPDYQRAFSWEEKQIDLFISDLKGCQEYGRGYYFGHFIVEDDENEKLWEVVDGQQRLTTFVLFLMVCRVLLPDGTHEAGTHEAYSLIERFLTVSYDRAALKAMNRSLKAALEMVKFDPKRPPSDSEIRELFDLHSVQPQEGSTHECFTRSQSRIALGLLRFHQAFEKMLDRNRIGEYIEVIMKAQCSCHRTNDKSVAVSIFELHNTRGVPLSTIEIVKAKLMKFVYDHGGPDKADKVVQIQNEFGQIYGMEEQLAVSSFRGKMSMEQLLRLHLRVVDDGSKNNRLDSPALNANGETLISYIETQLDYEDGDTAKRRDSASGVRYALGLAKEFAVSARIVSQDLPLWDDDEKLVGDVLILEQQLSCQMFLLICRRMQRVDRAILLLWERLLFTRDFHGMYYRLSYRDNFPALFASCGTDEGTFGNTIRRYVKDGFVERTKGLQSIVLKTLEDHKTRILSDTFHWWWKHKMIYAIYKYEVNEDKSIRDVMKGSPSVEHILPQSWEELRNEDQELKHMDEQAWESFRETINGCIGGLGNLLLITRSENSSVGNAHPFKKQYERNSGSYGEHNKNPDHWKSALGWQTMIQQRGEKLYNFMLENLVGELPTSGESSNQQLDS